ncbi:hypothetical protein [Hymenobacter glaciei]|uniref:hypothetical protein n=1 Tax=Hymenobacter glaciei TaxID=877209 RepID=UPI0031EC1DE3
MKFALTLLLLLFTMKATAQTTVSSINLPSRVSTPLQFTCADTVRALHNLFKSKRSTGGWLTGSSAFFTTLTGVGTLADNNGKNCGGYFCPDTLGSALIIGIGPAPAWIPGSISLIRFNKRKEMAEIDKYEKTQKLPRYLQRRLAGRFFNTNY